MNETIRMTKTNLSKESLQKINKASKMISKKNRIITDDYIELKITTREQYEKFISELSTLLIETKIENVISTFVMKKKMDKDNIRKMLAFFVATNSGIVPYSFFLTCMNLELFLKNNKEFNFDMFEKFNMKSNGTEVEKIISDSKFLQDFKLDRSVTDVDNYEKMWDILESLFQGNINLETEKMQIYYDNNMLQVKIANHPDFSFSEFEKKYNVSFEGLSDMKKIFILMIVFMPIVVEIFLSTGIENERELISLVNMHNEFTNDLEIVYSEFMKPEELK